MNDGSNREAADKVQNSLLVSQMAEAEQEFPVMCSASVVLEPNRNQNSVLPWGALCLVGHNPE